jgi:hypothetical protein
LLDADNRPAVTGITTDRGTFRIKTFRMPARIKISYLGYETLSEDIEHGSSKPVEKRTIIRKDEREKP